IEMILRGEKVILCSNKLVRKLKFHFIFLEFCSHCPALRKLAKKNLIHKWIFEMILECASHRTSTVSSIITFLHEEFFDRIINDKINIFLLQLFLIFNDEFLNDSEYNIFL